MAKNMFEEVATKHQKEELTRKRILNRIKSNDIAGAQKLAAPYLKKLSEIKAFNKPLPTGWVRISQALCTLDINQYGVAKGQTAEEEMEINDNSWIAMACKLINTRLQGIKKSLIPASMAIALMAQVLQPLTAKADKSTPESLSQETIMLLVLKQLLDQPRYVELKNRDSKKETLKGISIE